MSSSPSILWFRRDLRTVDHDALSRAVADGPVVPLFIVDPAFDRAGMPRRAALASALAALNAELGGSLVVRRGHPAEVLAEVRQESGASTVHVTREYSPFGRRRDEEVATALASTAGRLVGTGSNYLVAPGGVVKDDGSSYAVFTPFRRRWRERLAAAPNVMQAAPVDADWVSLSGSIDLAEIAGSHDLIDDELVHVSRASAMRRWSNFREDGLDNYRSARDLPAVDGTSRLSTALKFGVVHPRRLLADLDPGSEDHATFESELAWRDFYADVLYRRPDSAWSNLDMRLSNITLDTDAAAKQRFQRWCDGMTGFDIVDAGMRQLRATGWMHNRVRMIVASFLVKDLHLPWQWGARWFMTSLVDGDLASNNHGWQWAAGTGTDAAPYFRVFNPITQADKWDPTGEYRDRWIPERGTSSYPSQMVDHAAERVEALRRYEEARRV